MSAETNSPADHRLRLLDWITGNREGEPREISDMIRPGANISAVESLEVYRRAYWGRLLECLTAMFPVTSQWLGEEAFHGLAIGYLTAYPPRSYTLHKLADRFVEFLAETRPPRETEAADDFDFVIDLIGFERLLEETFDGPGEEEHPPDASLDTLTSGSRDFSSIHFRFNSSLRIFESRFPLQEAYTALKQGETIELPHAERSWAAVFRVDYVVRRLALSPAESDCLRKLVEGKGIVQTLDELPPEIGPNVLRDWFSVWTRRGILCGIYQNDNSL